MTESVHSPSPEDETPPSAARDGRTYEVLWKVEEGGGAVDGELPSRFELQRDLGDGVAGPLFLVRDARRGGAQVKLEVISGSVGATQQQLDALQEAVAAAARANSPHVVRGLEVGRLGDGRLFALYAHTDGETLESKLAREGDLHPVHALEIARQMLEALQALRAAGARAGRVSTRHVWLESHVPKRDANPFGVGVRLLVDTPAWGDPRARELDLRGVGALLDAMLGSTQSDGALHVAARELTRALLESDSSEAALGAARRSIDRLLQRARRGVAPATWRDRRRPIAAMTAAAGLVLFAAITWSSRREAVAAQHLAAEQRSRFDSAQAEALARIDRLRSELAEGEVALNAQLNELEAALLNEGALLREASSVQQVLRTQLESERDHVTRLSRTLDEERARRDALQLRLDQALSLTERSVRAARGLDGILLLLEARDGARASERATALEAEGLWGSRTMFVVALTRASERLQLLESEREPADDARIDVQAVAQARFSAEEATQQLDGFLAETADWIELELADSPSGPRAERLRRALASVHDRVRAADAELELVHERRFHALRALPALDDPTPAFEHAERFGCRHLDELGARFVRELVATTTLEGSIDARRLLDVTSLAAWRERVRDGRVRLSEELQRDLHLLCEAQRWYDAGSAPFEPPAPLGAADAVHSDGGGAWRDQLALQWHLARDDEALLLEPGRTCWRLDVDPSGRVEWWRDTVDDAANGVRRIRRTRFAADGATSLGEGVIGVERQGERLRLSGARLPLLDLRASGPEVAVSPTPVPDSVEPPPALGLSGESVRAARESAAGELCLVYAHGNVRRWVSPTLGIVREETRTPHGVAVTQLVGMAR